MDKIRLNKDIEPGECIILDGSRDIVGQDIYLFKNNSEVREMSVTEVTPNNPIILNNGMGTIVISDKDFDEFKKVNKVEVIRCYDLKDTFKLDDIGFILLRDGDKSTQANFVTSEDVMGARLTDMFSFILILISMSLLSSIGSMLYFWTLSEIRTEQKRYKILYCIGGNKRSIAKIIDRQIIMLFLTPYLVSSLNLIMLNIYLIQKNMMNSIYPSLYSVLGYSVVYMLYYLLTKREYKKIAQEI